VSKPKSTQYESVSNKVLLTQKLQSKTELGHTTAFKICITIFNQLFGQALKRSLNQNGQHTGRR